ncbi:hypothetical protein FNL55_02255 [Tardiphaga sp. vice352]|uniref:hypothetical protein n=1 Tax=unclassified Tardiphaga TaxID=2631404 RepID=UPI00116308FA|nr:MULTISPECIES: hypothetical protein [unclassified Tardiphaga]QDM14901.1 hypothetical protein FNL53_02250 [Tardiphaga sp. vice278]QDM20008.1 hypothetical protein FIU28_01720 [Tardiphaga sp. vice154]QDM25081.1 hypothetical protein FNL56_02160 [Tardiphaga sp. vice304]QDM30292.1 hypothetical protein FNL55_02255 [Tardiphaga sp. vice352]
MNTVIDSGTWTGISTDPYAALDAQERSGELRFDESRKLWWWGALGLPSLAAFGAWLIYAEYAGDQSTGRYSALLNLPYYKTIMGLLMMAVAIGAIPRWRRRLADRSKTAPLFINDRDLRFGIPSQSIKLSAIKQLTFTGASGTVDELAEKLSPWAEPGHGNRGGSMAFAIVSLIINERTTPVQLDLATLKGHPPRIGLILCDRIQKQQASVGSHV